MTRMEETIEKRNKRSSNGTSTMVEVEELPSDYEEEEGEAVIRQRKPAQTASSSSTAAIDLSEGKQELIKRIITEGAGEPCGTNKRAVVHYTGRFTDGRVFDSSVSRGTPFTFEVGHGRVISGWDVGVASMKKGEKAILTCKPNYAYGSSGNFVIPPNSTLEFEVEVIDFEEISGTPQLWVLLVLILLLGLLYSRHFAESSSPIGK